MTGPALPPFAEAMPLAWRGGEPQRLRRAIPEETPVALTFDGTSYAVMMATPSDLTDFAIGFAITEDVIDAPGDIESLEIVEAGEGIEARMWLKPEVSQRQRARRRSILGPTGCGLCGSESIEQALKPVRTVESAFKMRPGELSKAMSALQEKQALNARTHAVHAAGLYVDGGISVREDVGRHNALDKLIGSEFLAGAPMNQCVVLLSGRIGFELVQKCVVAGIPVLAAVGAPSSLAVETARRFRVTMVGFLRNERFNIYTGPERIS